MPWRHTARSSPSPCRAAEVWKGSGKFYDGWVLEPILSSVRARLPETVEREVDLRAAAENMPPVRAFAAALVQPELTVIAEFKRRSPSRGVLSESADPVARAKAYADAGAAAISILTEPDHFGGSLDDLRAIREAVDLPILRKDFILHPAQVWEAREAGADAVLLIASVLEDNLAELIHAAEAAGVEALVETHDKTEIDHARASGARIIGVNNRDLTTFEVDIALAEECRDRIGAVDATVAESGILGAEEAKRMVAAGYDAVLVGEALMRSPDPAELIASMRVMK